MFDRIHANSSGKISRKEWGRAYDKLSELYQVCCRFAVERDSASCDVTSEQFSEHMSTNIFYTVARTLLEDSRTKLA